SAYTRAFPRPASEVVRASRLGRATSATAERPPARYAAHVSDMRPIFLLGMMGAGKTSVGRLLAARRAATFVDLDVRIELLFGASIAALFEHGESHFRACERAAL